MSKNHYDYIIIGNGLAGLQLALAFNNDSHFTNKRIALIDPSTKTSNDKTWSFYGLSLLQSIIKKIKENTSFRNQKHTYKSAKL